MKEVRIGKHLIGGSNPCYIIAEIGVNHEGDFEIAKQMIWDAKNSGASAVKFQIVLADTLFTKKNREENEFYCLFKSELTEEEYIGLKSYADELGIDCFASFNDRYGVNVSHKFDAPAFKIASTQLANIPLIDFVARQGKPIILSTGMSSASQIDEAVDTILTHQNDQLVILHCVSNYPTLPEQVNLNTIDFLKKYGFPIGFSDHTIDNIAAIIAVAKGASVIEKHFTYDKKRPSFDHRLSCEPNEFKQVVNSIRITEKMLGSGLKRLNEFELEAVENYSVKLVAAENITEGELITEAHISASRNKQGIPGSLWKGLLDKAAKRNIESGEVFRWSDLED